MNTTMNLAILTLALSGCVAQPQVATPTSTPTYTAPISREADCNDAFISILAYIKVATPSLDACMAGKKMACGAVWAIHDRLKNEVRLDAASACLANGWVSGYNPLLLEFIRQAPPFLKKMEKFTKSS